MAKHRLTVNKDIDDLSEGELQSNFDQTIQDIATIRARWPGLVRLEESARKTHPGRAVFVLTPALTKLFGILVGNDGKPTDVAKHFDSLGEADHGTDPAKFEADLLARRLKRVQCEQKIQEELDDLARHFGDDALNTGGLVVGPGAAALGLARALAVSSATMRSIFAPVLDTFRELTKAARAAAAETRAKKTDGVKPGSAA
jgi:hypothetical protein